MGMFDKPVTQRNVCSWKAPDVTLVDGSVVKSDSEPWRFECEARHILRMPTKDTRISFLDMIEKKRGKPYRDRLESKILEIWRSERFK